MTKIPQAREAVETEHVQMKKRKGKEERKAENWGNMVERFLPIGQKRERSIDHGIGYSRSTAQESVQSEDQRMPARNSLHVAGALLSLPVTLPLVVVAKSRLSSSEAQVEGHSITPHIFAYTEMIYSDRWPNCFLRKSGKRSGLGRESPHLLDGKDEPCGQLLARNG